MDFAPTRKITARKAGVYRFVAEYPYSGVSGWRWFLYRLEK
jgi:hypothetical protein